MKINEVTIKRITEEDWTDIVSTDDKPWYKPDYQSDKAWGDVDENFQTTVIRMVASGAMTAILKKLAIKHINPRLAAAIPGVGIGAGMFLAYKSYKRGDPVGVVLDLLLGLSGGSVVGWKAFVGLLAFTIWREIYKLVGDMQGKGEFPSVDLYNKIKAGEGDEWVDNAKKSLYFFPHVLEFTGDYILDYFSTSRMKNDTQEAIRMTQLSDLTEEEIEMAEEIFELTYGQSREELQQELVKSGSEMSGIANQ